MERACGPSRVRFHTALHQFKKVTQENGMTEQVVEVRSLTKKFGDFTAVNDVSFSVGRGEIFGFLGPNGAGKTTTIKMLCGIITPTTGEGK
ncbi:MAG: ATP-binding cassette domain-containing protein, partial [Chrysiogenales bacterium]